MNKEFFKIIDTEIKAYLLGFIVADGSIGIRNHARGIEYSLSFSLHNRDTYIFELFKNHVKHNLNLGFTKNTPYIRFSIYGKEFIGEILKYGYGPRKTYTEMNLPNINNDLLIHFIRGYFDGDGTCTVNIVNEKGYKRAKQVFHIFSKKKQILIDIQKYFEINNVNLQIYYIKFKDGYLIKTCKQSTIKQLYHLFYDNSMYYFLRKQDSFKNAMITSSKFKELKSFELCNA